MNGHERTAVDELAALLAASKGAKPRPQDNSLMAQREYAQVLGRVLKMIWLIRNSETAREGTWEYEVRQWALTKLLPKAVTGVATTNEAYQKGALAGHMYALHNWALNAAPSDECIRFLAEPLSEMFNVYFRDRDLWEHKDFETFKALSRGFADGLNTETVYGKGVLRKEKGARSGVFLKLWEHRDTVNRFVSEGKKREELRRKLFGLNNAPKPRTFEKLCEDIGLMGK